MTSLGGLSRSCTQLLKSEEDFNAQRATYGSENLTQRVNKLRELRVGSENPTQRVNKLRELTVPVPGGPNDSENQRTKCKRSSCLSKAFLVACTITRRLREAYVFRIKMGSELYFVF